MSNPLPSQGWNRRYSGDFSKYTWLLNTNSISRGSTNKTYNLGPNHSLKTSLKSLPFSTTFLKTSAIEIEANKH